MNALRGASGQGARGRTPRALACACTLLLAGCASAAGGPAAGTPAPSAVPPIACNSDSVRLEVAAGVLAGTATCPTTPAPWPVALIVAGSGPTDRDGNSAGVTGRNDSLRMLAEALAVRGIASLRYDKRGIGASRSAATAESDLRFEMFAADASAWAARLRADPRFATVTIVGHSEGSLLGMLAARRAGADAFVSVTGIGRRASAVIHDQLAARAPALMAEADRVMRELDQGRTVDSVTPVLGALFRPSVQPYLVSWFRYDPSAELRRLELPVLIAQGSTDIQVGVQDARLLAAASPSATLAIIEGMNHVLKLVPPDQSAQMRSYSDPSLPVAPDLVDAIARFVRAVRRR